jgi:5,10-methylenetetrahydromethanopterin reductase
MNPRPLSELREAVEFFRQYTRGEEAEFKGARMHSEWIREPIPVYIACTHGSRSLEMAGELGDGVIIGDSHPEIVRWRMEQIAKGAERVGRDPSKIDVWVRTEIFIARSKEEARREVASYAATWARARYWSITRKTPAAAELAERMEAVEPGVLDELEKVYEAWTPSQHEVLDAPASKLVSQRLLDFNYLTGTPEDICDRIYRLGELGVKNISSVSFTIIDKKGMMREIGDKIMPHFRN